ncbi:MAG: hypothetical protein K8U03_05585 [Planctomycetia bacterium]|nr:hypothetical protein [Planctomycetia bacterium]
MDVVSSRIPRGYSYLETAGWFAAGAVVTAIFSGSLAWTTERAGLMEVLIVGMLVPSFTWVVQISASAIGLAGALRQVYWGDLGRICLIGSVALLPAAIVNLCLSQAPIWVSAVNVLASVAIMAAALFRLTRGHGIAPVWPVSWCLTITVNMCLFVWSSWGWW